MVYLVGYIGALISFAVVDAAWLRLTGRLLYRPTLGDILLAELRLGPAIAFYLAYPIGIFVLAVLTALKVSSLSFAVGSGREVAEIFRAGLPNDKFALRHGI